jgi:hypothetical protein
VTPYLGAASVDRQCRTRPPFAHPISGTRDRRG